MMFEPGQPIPTTARDVNRISKPIEVDEPATVAASDVNGASKPKYQAKGKGRADD